MTIETLRKVGWTARSLTEDLEFQMQCLLKGIPAGWSHEAKVYDEKPTDFIASCIQRLRWARGHWDVCFKYSLPLIWRSISKLDIRAFDGFMYLINPGKIVLATMTAIIVAFGLFLPEDIAWFKNLVPVQLWLTFLVFNILYIGYSMFKDSTAKFSKLLVGIIFLPIFNYTYVALFVWALLTKNNKTWKRTEHSRSIALDEVQL